MDKITEHTGPGLADAEVERGLAQAFGAVIVLIHAPANQRAAVSNQSTPAKHVK
jgi:hypothetical protein